MKRRIRNENDMLGVLISRMDKNNDVDNISLINESSNFNFDKYSMNISMMELERRHYIIRTLDTTTITMLGVNNYISLWDKALSWLISLLKFSVSYTLGILSGVLVAYFIVKLGLG